MTEDFLDSNNKWRKLSSNSIYRGCVDLRNQRYEMPNGSIIDWEIIQEGNTVGIIAFTEDIKVVYFKQYRPGPDEILMEIPGGFVEENESIEAAAFRELTEETGYRSDELMNLGFEWTSARSTRKRYIMIATNCASIGDPQWDKEESGVVGLMSLGEFVNHVLSGRTTDAGPVIRGLHYFAKLNSVPPKMQNAQVAIRSILSQF